MDNKEIFNRIFPTACRYMRVNPLLVDEEFNLKSFKVFETLMENVRFKGQHEYISVEDLMNVDKELTGKSEDLIFYLEGCTEAVVFATTLGVNVDAYSKKLQSRDMSLAHTFRFAPGYGDIPIELNYIIIDALSISKKIGIYKSSNNMMLPQKSMITFCGLGKEVAPTCAHCIRLNNCSLRKEGFRCYNS